MGMDVAGLHMRNPVMMASGIHGCDAAMMRAAYDAGAGAVVTKSVTLKPRRQSLLSNSDMMISDESGGGG